MSTTTSTDCTDFRPHHLRPDKCRKCFGDKSRHENVVESKKTEATSDQNEEKKGKESWKNEISEMSKEELVKELKGYIEERERNELSVKEKSQLVTNYELEIERLKLELKSVREQGKQQTNNVSSPVLNNQQIELDKCRSECKRLEEERDQCRDELKAMEREMEELHDNFKEEESEQFEQVKQELDVALKNCKILQIRLNKSERQYNQLEQIKQMLERQLEDYSAGRQLEPSIEQQVSSNFVQLGPDCVKLSTAEYDQLLRDLNDTIERERDLQEQIKYSQEEAQLKEDRLQAAEAENEVLLSKVNKLTAANSRFRSRTNSTEEKEANEDMNMIEQNEQLKLALDLAQSECDRLRAKLRDSHSSLELKEMTLKESETKRARVEDELVRFKTIHSNPERDSKSADVNVRLELECRQLRTRLVRSERECKQLKAQLEMTGRQSIRSTGESSRANIATRSQSVDLEAEQARYKEQNRQLREQCELHRMQLAELEKKVETLNANQNVGQTMMENDLLEKLKHQLEVSENELAKTRSRLVEVDVEKSKNQRQYKRLVESLQATPSVDALRKLSLPSEASRDSMSRQELRQAMKDLEEEVAKLMNVIKSKDCLLRELEVVSAEASRPKESSCGAEQEQQLVEQLKLEVSRLERELSKLQLEASRFKRERTAMEEELEKLRQLNQEYRSSLEESRKSNRVASARLKDLQSNYEELRLELTQTREQLQHVRSQADGQSHNQQQPDAERDSGASSPTNDLLLMARDLSELKVKNNFLMRQIEISREETSRQLEDLRESSSAQQRRAVELAQLELKERQLAETQQLRDELNETKQKLASSQRQTARNEEEANCERDRLRSLERDWRRDKSQWMQRLEQLEAQLAIEKRSNEFRLKEAESQVRDKERELISMQDKYVQLERDLKRTQNKFSLFEENSESRQKQLSRELELKKRELSEFIAKHQGREEEYYDNCKRFNNEKATLLEALESIKRSYDEKLAELKSVRELLLLRQDQAYKERSSAQDRLESLNGQLMKMSEYETQSKLLSNQLQVQEKQLESLKRELSHLKEERIRLRGRAEEFERRCQEYEKRELISKTSSISASSSTHHQQTNSFLKSSRNPFSSLTSSNKKQTSANESHNKLMEQQQQQTTGNNNQHEKRSQCLMIEKLTSKINDQRQLINLLKQQHGETQMELKQLKLLQSSERNKWQSRVAQLTSRLNESEEKLLFESSALLGQEMFENSRRKVEIKWAEERQATLNMLQQQQSQNEFLMRDLKKLGQSHDLLRLQSKQLESQNNKLSRKLIEYQQNVGAVGGGGGELARKLDECLAERRQLEEENAKLARVMREETRPLVETVGKIMATLDSVSSSDNQGLKQQASLESNEPAERPNSTHRPLMTGSNRLSDESSSEAITTAPPAHQVAASQQKQSRFARLLSPKPGAKSKDESATELESKTIVKGTNKTTGTKRLVRVKCSTLGITPGEKKELKRHLQELNNALSELSNSADSSKFNNQQRSNSVAPQLTADNHRVQSRGQSYTPTRTIDSSRVVHWAGEQDSDLDSERSWSINDTSGRSNLYRRFPQSSPGTYGGGGGGLGASLTDYDSETSLASECSTYSMGAFGFNRSQFASGAESDSCMTDQKQKLKGNRKQRGLKVRLTSTIRNISRSIGGLASDSEASAARTASTSQQGADSREVLKEIRV